MSDQKITVVKDESHPTSVNLRDAIGKTAELNAMKVGLERKRDALLEERRKLIGGTRAERFGREADALLDGRKLEDNSSMIEKLNHEIEVVDLAIEKQQQAVSELRGKFSRYVCDHPANKATYLAIEKRIAAALAELAAANQAEQQFFDKLYEVGCSSVSFRRMALLKEIGVPSDPNSRASLHKREMEQFVPEAV